MPDSTPPFVSLDDLTAEQVIDRIDVARRQAADAPGPDRQVAAGLNAVMHLLILDRIERNAPAWAAAEIGQLEPAAEPALTDGHVAHYQTAWRHATAEAARHRAMADMPGSDGVNAVTAERYDREAAGHAAALRTLGADVPGAAPVPVAGPSDDELVGALTDTGDGAHVMFASGDDRIPVVVARIRRLLDAHRVVVGPVGDAGDLAAQLRNADLLLDLVSTTHHPDVTDAREACRTVADALDPEGR